MILPWDVIGSPVTKDNYMRKARPFLAFAGYLDSRLYKHGPGLSLAVEA